MALTLNLIAIPVVAGLVAGTGAVASYVADTSSTSAPVARVEQPCAAQTWPYIDGKCLGGNEKRVRLVMAPRAETPEALPDAAAAPAPAPQNNRAATPEMLTSRDTVLRQPDVSPAPKPKARAKRSERTRWVAQSYQVPVESRTSRSGAVLVVRPLRLEQFR